MTPVRTAICLGVALFSLTGATSARAGAWTLPKGDVWVKIGAFSQLTDEFYADAPVVLAGGRQVEAGDRRIYDDEGASRVRVVISEAEVGVTDRITLGLQVPFYTLRWEDRVQIIDSQGVGDIRAQARVGLVTTGMHRVSVRTAWKLPTGRAATNPDVIPVGEGQTDLEFAGQWGRSLGRELSWVGAEGGRRFRAEDSETGRDPGDEWFWLVEGGYGVSRHGAIKVMWEGLHGGPTSTRVLGNVENLRRRVQSFSAFALVNLGPSLLELGWTRSLAGRSFPAGNTWSLAVSSQVTLF